MASPSPAASTAAEAPGAAQQASSAWAAAGVDLARVAEACGDVLVRLRLVPRLAFEYLSPSAEALLGRSAGDLREDALRFLDAVHPEDREVFEALAAHVGDGPATVEFRVAGADGSEAWLEARMRVARDDRGAVAEGVLRDVTRRKRAEEDLRFVLGAVRGLAEASEFDEGLGTLLASVARACGWAYGQAWLRTPPDGALSCASTWHEEDPRLQAFRATTSKVRLRPGQSLPGRAWALGRAVWLPDAPRDPNFLRAVEARRAGLSAAVAIPVACGSSTVAVLVFFARTQRRPDTHALELMGAVASQLGSLMLRRRAEAQVRDLLESAPDALVAAGPDGTILLANAQAERLFGYPRDKLLGKPVEVLVPEAQRAAHADHRRSYAGAPRQRPMGSGLELRARRSDGSEVPVEVSLSPLWTEQGLLVLAAVRDVTDSKAAERALRESEAMLAEAQRIGQIGSWSWEPGPDVIRWSAELCRIFGVEPGTTLRYAQYLDLIHPEDRALVERAVRSGFEGGTGFEFEHRIVRPSDGATRMIYGRGKVVRSPQGCSKGSVVRMVGTGQDVTEARAAEADQRRLTRTLAEAQRLAALGSWDWDPGTDEVVCSEELCRIFGLQPSSGPRPLAALLDRLRPLDVSRLRALLGKASTGHGVELEHGVVLPGGEERRVHTRCTAGQGRSAHGDGPPVLCTSQDITARRAAEARQARLEAALAEQQERERAAELRNLREADAFRSRLLNIASHELNTPLTSLRLQLDLLREDIASGAVPDQRSLDDLELLARNVDRLARLVGDMLDVSRLQSGRLALDALPQPLGPIVREAARAVEPLAGAAGVALRVGPVGAMAARVDAMRVNQVLMNLLGNAVKFTDRGGAVEVAAGQVRGEVVVEVRDTGLGLTPAQAARLFQPFVQVHGGAGSRGGTGLGLFIAKGIVEQHGGRIGVRSDGPGQGSTFWFTLPAAEPGACAAPPDPGGRVRGEGSPAAGSGGIPEDRGRGGGGGEGRDPGAGGAPDQGCGDGRGKGM